MANNKEVASQDYEQAPEYQQHVQAVLASYDNPEGLLGELVGQLADAFWLPPRQRKPHSLANDYHAR